MTCPNCNSGSTLIPVQKDVITKYKGRKYRKIAYGHRCMNCGESFVEDITKMEEFHRSIDDFMDKVDKETEHLTCNTCPSEPSCPYRWDLYNTNGDCLAMK